MNEYQKYIDLIYVVIDGEASDVETSTLFDALHNNQELQQEFQTALRMNKAAEAIPALNVVPPLLTDKLFNKAGLNYTGNANFKTTAGDTSPVPLVLSNSGLIANLTAGKFGFGILGIFIGGLLGFFITVNSGIGTNQSKSFSANQEQPDYKNNLMNINNETKLLSENKYGIIRRNHKSGISKEMPVSDNFSKLSLNEKLSFNSIESHFSNEDNLKISAINFTYKNNILKNSSLKNNRLNDFAEMKVTENHNNINYSDYQENKRYGLELEIRGSSSWNIPQETVFPSEISKLYNMDLFVFYNLNNHISIGAGVKQETFYAKYIVTEGINHKLLYEQQPNFVNFELAARVLPFKPGIINPLLQANAGGGHYGYTYRFALGSEFSFHDDLSFICTIDFASLRYNHQGDWNSANKLGINYGINYKF